MNTETRLREDSILRGIMASQFYNAAAAVEGYVAGGAVRSVFAAEPINDFDIFFRSHSDFDRCVEILGDGDSSPSFTVTDTAWTHVGEDKNHYQLICAVYGEPEEVLKNFDFTCCMGAWMLDGTFAFDANFFIHCSQRRLVFNPNAGFPICSLWRAVKFVKRGWKLPGIEAIKLALAINHLKLTDHRELKRQLMGIDTLFLKELTDALEANKEAVYDFGEAIDMLIKFADREDS